MRLNKAFQYTTILLGLFPLLKHNHFSILMIVWFILAICLSFKNKKLRLRSNDLFCFVLLAFCFLMYVLYLPFVTDFKELSKQIIKSLPFLIFPLGFLWNKIEITKSLLNKQLQLFVAAVVVLNCLGWIQVFQSDIVSLYQTNDFYNPTFRNVFTQATKLHLPYLGLFTTFSCLYLVYKQVVLNKFKVLSNLIIGFLAVSMYIYSARMALVCLVVGIVFLLFNALKSRKVKIISAVIIPLIALIFVVVSPLKDRYSNVLETELVLPHKGQMPHEVNYRYGIWYCASTIIKENFLLGVAPDQAQNQLNSCYTQFDYQSYEDFSKVVYNSHNQYLDQTIKFGIIGLLLFVVCLGYFLPKADIFYQTFGIIVAISFLTENYLDRQMGVVFIALFNTIFVIYNNNKREKSISS